VPASTARDVLLVSHEATRTGAPKVAVQLARALGSCGYRVTTLLRWDGPLRPEMASASSRLVLEPLRRVRAALRMRFPRASFSSRVEELEALLTLLWLRPAYVYVNTVKSASYVRPARWLRIPVVLHVHEVGALAERTLARYRLDKHYDDVQLVACSYAVARSLSTLTGISLEHIAIVPSLIDADAAVARSTSGQPMISDGTLVVGACAVANKRKGIDLWLRMVAEFAKTCDASRVRFVWVGAHGSDPMAHARELGIADLVTFTGELENPLPTVALFDIFTLPSREDPFPLAVLEAMALGRPVVAFAVDGVVEQLGDVGVLVPAEDVEALANAVAGLLAEPARRAALGQASARRVRTQFGIDHFDRAVCGAMSGARSPS
jgi:glycosyltransferase involved in cell wall biosynthesis